jgi:hypothetical protein
MWKLTGKEEWSDLTTLLLSEGEERLTSLIHKVGDQPPLLRRGLG